MSDNNTPTITPPPPADTIPPPPDYDALVDSPLVRRELSTGIYRAVLALPSNSPAPQKKDHLNA